MDERQAIVAEVLGEHARGDWSDHTYSCQGCAQRTEDAQQHAFDTLGRQPTREELVAARNEYSLFSHPGWSLADYHAHVAAALEPMLAKWRAEDEARALREAAAEVGPALVNEVGSGHTSTYSVRRWLSARAALAEEGL